MAGTAVVVLTIDAAAGRGLLIYLCSAADRLEKAAFCTFFQPFPVAQTAPFMGQPFPPERRNCSTDSRVCYISGCHPLYKGITH